MTDQSALPYRPCAGVMLANRAGRVFVGQRLDTSSEAWQMPQGGIDPGESAEEAAIRELGEETGVHGGLVEIIARSKTEYFYDLPDHLMGIMWGGKYRGQRQKWFLLRYLGRDDQVNIETDHPEFDRWQWSRADEMIASIVPFKRAVYEKVVAEFRHLAGK